jgi:NAD(P)-dependent dehydrogenase (short-subunit alcohol dehydrogenase family)
MHKAVIMGVGPDRGLGAQLCKRFAKEGLHVVAAGRTPGSLDAVVADIERSGGEASSFVSDATKEADVAALFEHAGSDVDLAIYNAGNNTPGRVLEMEADYFEKSWRVACYGGFLFGREALRRMVPRKQGAILFTGASASLRGRAGYGAFNSAKAGLRTLAQAMAPRASMLATSSSTAKRYADASRTPTRAETGWSISRVSSSATPSFIDGSTKPGPSRSTCARPWKAGELVMTGSVARDA